MTDYGTVQSTVRPEAKLLKNEEVKQLLEF